MGSATWIFFLQHHRYEWLHGKIHIVQGLVGKTWKNKKKIFEKSDVLECIKSSLIKICCCPVLKCDSISDVCRWYKLLWEGFSESDMHINLGSTIISFLCARVQFINLWTSYHAWRLGSCGQVTRTTASGEHEKLASDRVWTSLLWWVKCKMYIFKSYFVVFHFLQGAGEVFQNQFNTTMWDYCIYFLEDYFFIFMATFEFGGGKGLWKRIKY